MVTTPIRTAIFGLIAEPSNELVELRKSLSRETGSDLSTRFPLHVTLRGRFWMDEQDLPALDTELEELEAMHARTLRLGGPALVLPDLLWLRPVDPSALALLRAAHERVEEVVNRYLLRDEVPDTHSGPNYDPHLSLCWGASSKQLDFVDGQTQYACVMRGPRIAVYPQAWPASGSVEIWSDRPSPIGARHETG